MKGMLKIFNTVLITLLFASTSFAAGTVTQSLSSACSSDYGPCVRVLTLTCTADASAATYPSTAISTTYTNALKGYYLYKVITNPGSPAPTDNWDFTLTDGDGIDVLGGAGANHHTTTSQMFAPLIATGVYFAQPMIDQWTLAVSGNSQNSAVTVIKLIFAR